MTNQIKQAKELLARMKELDVKYQSTIHGYMEIYDAPLAKHFLTTTFRKDSIAKVFGQSLKNDNLNNVIYDYCKNKQDIINLQWEIDRFNAM